MQKPEPPKGQIIKKGVPLYICIPVFGIPALAIVCYIGWVAWDIISWITGQ